MNPTASPLRAVAELSRDLAGSLRPASIADTTARHLLRAFEPIQLVIALRDPEAGVLSPVHLSPAGIPFPAAVMESIARDGLLLPDAPHIDRSSLAPCCIGTPLRTRHGSIGAVLVGGPAGRYGPDDLALLEALTGPTSLALDIAWMLDTHESSRRSWEEAVDAIPLALCIVDTAGRIRRANRAFATLVGSPIVTVVGRHWNDLVPPDWRPGVERAIAAEGLGREAELRTDQRTYAVTAYRVAAGRAALVVIFDDQTDRRRLQDQLIQSEKLSAIGQLIAGVAHDLNNPLASVVGFADFLAEAADVSPNMAEPLKIIQQEAERAAAIVRHLLTFARKQEHRRRLTPLPPLLEGVMSLLKTQLMADQIDLVMEVEADLPSPTIDANQMQQVFLNLVHNAAQAIRSAGRRGRVTLRARRWLDGIAVDVIDDGPGMAPAVAAQAFEPFYTTKPEGEGTGLGLSISQGIVKEHGGRITLATAVGQGATFTVELPVTRPSLRPTPPPLSPRISSRFRVLVIDDELPIQHYMRATLESWGHTVDVAPDGATGLDLARTGDHDLIITDLRMPGMSGRDVHTELERTNPDLVERLVFSTGDTVRGDTLAFLERAGRPCLHKPFSLTELRALLEQLARARSGDPEAFRDRRDTPAPQRR